VSFPLLSEDPQILTCHSGFSSPFFLYLLPISIPYIRISLSFSHSILSIPRFAQAKSTEKAKRLKESSAAYLFSAK